MNDHSILSHPYDTAHLPPAGTEVTVGADAAARAALAESYDLLAVDGLSASATLTPSAGDMVSVAGRVVADIVQACVVSLEPVPQHIDETFQIDFIPAETAAKLASAPAREVAIDPDAPDPPEVMDGTTIDLGALVEEMFVLAIDPYPRAPGAELAANGDGAPDSQEESPFAVLREVMRTRK